MSTYNIQLLCRKSERFPKLSLFASLPCAMINPQWLEIPISRTNFHGPKDVRAIEVRLYIYSFNAYTSLTPLMYAYKYVFYITLLICLMFVRIKAPLGLCCIVMNTEL